MTLTKTTSRSAKQNRALHLYCEMLAEALNSSGLEMKKVLKPTVEIPWSKETVKEFIYKPVLKAYKGKDSTTKMDTKEVSEVFDIINRHFSEKWGLTVDFPSIDTVLWQKEHQDQ